MMVHGKNGATSLVGESPRMRQVLRLVEKLSRCRWPVLLLGETGTGKELVARAIHNANPLGLFVPIDCSALVGPLMESELFGHLKGSFTGAVNTKVGLIEKANGGTAFFDEIGELPLDMQVKLLRVLQEKEFRPVGSTVVRQSDFRLIAATNRDLAKEVERGTFRRDLYYRLNVVPLRVAPLRERKEDIPALIAHFLESYGHNHTITQETLDGMLSYDWPGNVRELEHCIQHMVAVNSGPLIHAADLPTALQNQVMARRGQGMAAAVAVAGAFADPAPRIGPRMASSPPPTPPVMRLIDMEKNAIIQALEYTKGDRMMAAQLLGIGRTTLYRKLKEYGLAR
jgi:transcriptional regulator with PAS, ATPase and Fis domain